MSTLATLLLRLAMDRAAYTSGLRAGKAEANDFAAGVTASMNQAANAATAAGAKIVAAQNLVNGAARGPGGRFVSPVAAMAQQGQAAAVGMNAAAAATNNAAGAVSNLNTVLAGTKLLLASFIVLGFIQFVTGAAKAATEFQSEMLLLRTQARASMEEVRGMTQALIEMAPAVRTGPEELAKGLYHIESVGLRGARALEVLTAAAQGARVGNADLESVTNALVASVTTGIKGIKDMSSAMGVLDGIVGSGNMRMEQLARSMSTGVLSTFKQFGLSIQDFGAALASMTDQGIPAQEASTRLRITIAQLGAPTKIAAEQLSRIGLTSRTLADEMRGPGGLIGALRVLEDHLQRSGLDATEQSQLLKNAFGGSRSSAGLLTLINSLDLMDRKMATIKAAELDFGEVSRIQAESAAGQFQKFLAVLGVLAIKLGDSLLPILIGVANAFTFVASQSGILVPILMTLTAIITALALKALAGLILALFQATKAMIANGIATIALRTQMLLLAASQVAAAISAGGLTAGLRVLIPMLMAVALPLTLITIALMLLILNFDRVAQGVRVLAYVFVGAVKTILDVLGQIPVVGEAFKGMARGLQDVMNGMVQGMAEAEQAISDKAKAIGDATNNVDPLAGLINSVADGTDDVIDDTKTLVELFGVTIDGVRKAAGAAGGAAMSEMASEIRKHQNDPLDALKTLHEMVRNQLTPTVEIARLYGMLISQDLAAGMASQDPAVFAQAQATKKLIEERLSELTDGAYQAGMDIAKNLNQGMSDYDAGYAALQTGGAVNAQSQAWDKLKPSVDAVADAMKVVNDQLNETERARGLTQLNQAFSDISQSAHKFFDEVHRGNLQAISDAVAHKNALLDAKKALNQSPVTAAQKALDFQRSAIEEWRLRQAIAHASGPEAYRDAVLALQDFLAQKHIDEMQQQVDAANEKLDKQKDANSTSADAQKAAENRRYEAQKESFDRQLELLRSYLEKHPGEWQKTNEKVLGLLKSYGITYRTAGSTLGKYFAQGLKDEVKAAVDAAKAMANLIPGLIDEALGAAAAAIGAAAGGIGAGGGVHGPNTGGVPVAAGPAGPQGPGVIEQWDHGNWQVLQNNLLGMVHLGEMVTPADTSSILRGIGTRPMDFSMKASVPGGSRGDTGGGGTINVYLGDERVGEVIDHRLAIQRDIYDPPRVSTGSRR